MAILISQKDKASAFSEGLVRFATSEEATAGTRSDVAMSPALVKAQLETLIDGAPGALDTLNELAAAINDDASFFSSVQTDIDDLQTQINTLAGGDLSGLQDEIDDTQTGAGLGADGSYTADATTNYITAATSLKNADFRLDAQIKANADAIATLGNGNLTALQTEIDAIESSVGLAADGTKSDFSSANYIVASGSFKAAIEALDTQLKSTQDDLDTVEASLATAESEIDTLQTESADYESRITTLEGASTNQAEVDAIEASVGIGTDGSYTATSGANYTDSATSVRGEISALDTQIKSNADAIALRALDTDLDAVDVRLTSAESEIDTLQTESTDYESRITTLEAASGNQAEVDAIEASVGINTDGTFTANSSGNYISSATSVRGEINALDVQLKSTQDDLDAAESDIAQLQTDVATKASTTSVSAISTELTATQASAGFNADGTYSAHSGSNYIDGATTTKGALGLLDAEISTNATDITNLTATVNTLSSAGSANATEITALENEIDATQTGAGLSTTGAYTAPGASNYLGSATSLKDADNKLDAQIKTNADAIALRALDSDLDAVDTRLTTAEGEIDTLQSDLSAAESDILANAGNITTNATNISSLETDKAEQTSLDSTNTELTATQSAVGLNTDGTYNAHSGSNYMDGASSVKGALSSLDTQIKSNADSIALKASEADLTLAEADIASLESLADTHESSIGLNANGSYTSPSGTNYIDSATSVRNEASLLDTQVKANADAISAETSARQSADSTLTSSISTLQSEVDATQSGAGLDADGGYTAIVGANYISAATDLKDADDKLDTQIKSNADNISTNTSNISTNATAIATKASSATVSALQSEVDATQSGVGLAADGSYTTPAGHNYLGQSTLKADVANLDGQVKTNADGISTNASDISSLEALADSHEASIGLSAAGAYVSRSGSNYLDAASSVVGEITALDTQVKTNADAIALRALDSDLSSLQSEVDATQSGAGLAANGNFVAYAGTNYIDGTSNLAGAISTLDAAIKTRQDNIDTEVSARSSADSTLQSAIDTIESSVGLGTDGSFSITGTNYLNSTTDVIDALEILDTNLNFTTQVQGNIKSSAGFSADGTKTAYSSTNYISGSLKAAIEALDSQVKTNADDISGLGGSDIANLQSELDDTQTGVGLATDGSHVSRSGTNYLDSATSIVGEISALDTAVKSEETARTNADNALDTRLDTLEYRSGGIMIDVPASSAVEMDATLSQFRTHAGPWEINWSTFVSAGSVDIVMYGGQAVTNSSQHFIQKNDGDIVFTGNITAGASIYDDA